MSSAERKTNGIKTLPGSLLEAMDALECDDVIRGVLGSDIAGKYIAAKRAEYAAYSANVSQWEVDEYLSKI